MEQQYWWLLNEHEDNDNNNEEDDEEDDDDDDDDNNDVDEAGKWRWSNQQRRWEEQRKHESVVQLDALH
ncbi:MAG TPA: hypothetical protein V6C97_24295 [Oculatellaceae cyanobacterium]